MDWPLFYEYPNVQATGYVNNMGISRWRPTFSIFKLGITYPPKLPLNATIKLKIHKES